MLLAGIIPTFGLLFKSEIRSHLIMPGSHGDPERILDYDCVI